ncbi:MAG: DUF1492 domain-containing protein [Parabacteroides sp.]|nr:DUF1492 domain-containing protein [Parabacteroides sp.]
MGSRKSRDKKINYLNGYYWALENIKNIQAKIDRKNDRLYSVRSPKLSDMPRGGTPVTTLDVIADKEELEDDLHKRLRKAKLKKEEIERVIDDVEDPRYVMLLTLKYVDNLSWDQVAEEMNYSYSRITKLHGLALDEVTLPAKYGGSPRKGIAGSEQAVDIDRQSEEL